MLKYLTVVTIKHNSESYSSQLGNTDKAGAQDSTSTRCTLGTSSRVLRMPTESGDVIRYVFLPAVGLRPFMLDFGVVVNQYSRCGNS